MIKHVNESNFSEEVLSKSKVVLVDFFATWCGPCQMLTPVLEKISNSRADFDIVKVDIDQAIGLANKFKIQVVPTLLVFKDGKVVNQTEGYLDEDGVLSLVEEYI